MQTQNRLKIALQKKGRLSQDCAALLKQCGVKINWNEQRLSPIRKTYRLKSCVCVMMISLG